MQKTMNNPEYVAIKKIPAKSTGGDSCFIDVVRGADR